jgi:adenosylhomocysteine nucleosidase
MRRDKAYMKMNKIAILCALESEYLPRLFQENVFFTGLGKVNAAFKTFEVIQTFKPDLIINFSMAGAVNPAIEGLLEVEKVLQRDMITEPLAPRGITPFADEPLYLFSGYTGVSCGTGDSFITEEDPWLLQNQVDIVDMELYAIALVCERLSVPWRSFKFVTNYANETAESDWLENISRGQRLFDKELMAL